MESRAQTVSCDCEKQLVGDSKNASGHPAQLAQKDKYEETYITTGFVSINPYAFPTANPFSNKAFVPVTGFERSLFHPPAFS